MTAIVDIDWADSKTGGDLAGVYGPFESVEDAYAWGESTIRNGEWQVSELQEAAVF